MRSRALDRLMQVSTALVLLVAVFMAGARWGRSEAESKSQAPVAELTQAIATNAQRALDDGKLLRAFALTQLLEEHDEEESTKLQKAYTAVVVNKYNSAMDELDLARCRALLTPETKSVLDDSCPGLVEQMESQLKSINRREERPPVVFSLLSHRRNE